MENQTDGRERAIRAELEHARVLFREKRLQELIELLRGTVARYSIQEQEWDLEWPHPTVEWFHWENRPVEPQVWNVLNIAEFELDELKFGTLGAVQRRSPGSAAGKGEAK